jgi:hypothetical protein
MRFEVLARFTMVLALLIPAVTLHALRQKAEKVLKRSVKVVLMSEESSLLRIERTES